MGSDANHHSKMSLEEPTGTQVTRQGTEYCVIQRMHFLLHQQFTHFNFLKTD